MSRFVVAAAWVNVAACVPAVRSLENTSTPERNGDDESDEEVVWDGDYEISDEATLADLAGYSRVAGSLIVEGALAGLPGLEALRRVDRDIIVRNNEFLADVGGLSGLVAVGTIEVRGNALLPSLAGLGGLAAVDADFTVEANPALATLGGMSALRGIGGALVIADNPALVGIDGLDALEEVASTFWISGNAALVTLDGFDRLAQVDEFLVFENPALSTCAVEVFQEQLEIAGASYVDGNAPCP